MSINAVKKLAVESNCDLRFIMNSSQQHNSDTKKISVKDLNKSDFRKDLEMDVFSVLNYCHDKKNVFNKFYRVGNEETRKTKGTGLGLFIVQHLVKEHNGQINVKDNQPKGSIFAVTFFT